MIERKPTKTSSFSLTIENETLATSIVDFSPHTGSFALSPSREEHTGAGSHSSGVTAPVGIGS